MDKNPPARTLQAPGASPETAYELPTYDSRVKPSSPIREPGRSPSKSRAPAGSGVEVRLPGRGERLAPDDRLARPESGEEYIDGQCLQAMAGDADHADPQCDLAYVVRACVATGYVASTELLTRTDQGSDFATDVCVRKRGKDPETGGRYVEEISFEVAHTQTREDLERVRVPKLLAAGVRRIFAVLVPEGDVLEWSHTPAAPARPGEWQGWTPDQSIRDRVFKKALHVAAILDAAAMEKLVSQAQLVKREPHLMKVLDKREAEGRAEGRTEGRAAGYAEAILLAFESHNITLDAENRQAILDCQNTALLRRWLTKALVATSASDILAELEPS